MTSGGLPRTEARPGALLDEATPLELARTFQQADREAADAVARIEAPLAAAIQRVAETLEAGGRLILLGAGTSGRLAVIEAAECLPTFGSTDVVGLIAGGPPAFLRAQEGAEDDPALGASDLAGVGVAARDFVLGVAASGRTPYVWGALRAAREVGAGTGLLSAAPPPPGSEPLDLLLVLDTGPEVLSGSTRLKAGTATKCALNAITTGAMALRGKVLGDLMVDVIATNKKLEARARRIVGQATGAAPEAVEAALSAAGGEVKTAIVIAHLGLDAAGARARLIAAGGHLRRVLEASDSGTS